MSNAPPATARAWLSAAAESAPAYLGVLQERCGTAEGLYAGGIVDFFGGSFEPRKLLHGLARSLHERGVRFFQNTEAQALDFADDQMTIFCGSGTAVRANTPGISMAGFTNFDFSIIGKWLELLKEIAPGVRRMTFMFSPPTAPWVPLFLGELGTAPASLAVEFSKTPVHDEAEIEAAITAFARERGVG
jgi:hypothetical protein